MVLGVVDMLALTPHSPFWIPALSPSPALCAVGYGLARERGPVFLLHLLKFIQHVVFLAPCWLFCLHGLIHLPSEVTATTPFDR